MKYSFESIIEWKRVLTSPENLLTYSYDATEHMHLKHKRSLEILKRLKQSIDPKGILNP